MTENDRLSCFVSPILAVDLDSIVRRNWGHFAVSKKDISFPVRFKRKSTLKQGVSIRRSLLEALLQLYCVAAQLSNIIVVGEKVCWLQSFDQKSRGCRKYRRFQKGLPYRSFAVAPKPAKMAVSPPHQIWPILQSCHFFSF